MIEDSASPITGDPPRDGGAAHHWTGLRSVLPRGGGGWWGRWFSEPDRAGARPVKAAVRRCAVGCAEP